MDAFPFPPFPPPLLQRKGDPKHIVVIGAGLAGLNAAWMLTKAGHNVTVLEASDRAGGRVLTLRDGFSPGLHADAGASFVPGHHTLTVGYALEFGLRLVPLSIQGKDVYYLRGHRIDDVAHTRWPVKLNPDESATTPATPLPVN